MITKEELDSLAAKYETTEFIKDDPVQFAHKFKSKKDIEIASFISSLLAYGSRKQFIEKLNILFELAQNEPLNFIQNFESKMIGNFNYRFGKPEDFICIFETLKELYNTSNGLEELFEHWLKHLKRLMLLQVLYLLLFFPLFYNFIFFLIYVIIFVYHFFTRGK